MKGDPAATRGLLESGTCKASETNAYDHDLLWEACEKDNIEQLSWILENSDHSTLKLRSALARTIVLGSMKAVKLLLATRVQINPSKNGPQWMKFSLAGVALRNRGILEVLLDKGLLITGEDIVKAANKGYVETLALLIDHGSRDVEDLEPYLREALVQATENGYPRCRTMILKHLPQGISNSLDPSVGLLPAAKRFDDCSLRELFAMGALAADDGEALIYSCSFGHADTARALTDGHAYPKMFSTKH
ncbi:NACHT-ankyrin domain protein transcript variant [Colletotrichum tofieldiae]|nr:NACHT-ankyrin domain protein transcript variant [Colletotrichum tofieldiae]